ncbi:MAG: class I SAM-dependent methyltransferase [Nanoarchaeota archaeon]
MESQKQVWNKIADDWKEFREKPIKEVIEFLKTKTGKVLDLGSGAGRHLIKIKSGQMYLVDFSEKMIALTKQKAKKNKIRAEFFVADFNSLCFEKDFFDSAIFIDSLHCIEKKQNRTRIVKELFKALKPKAEVFVSLWNKNSKRFENSQKEKIIKWKNKGERYYYLYSEKQAHKEFEKQGFKIKKSFSRDMKIMFIVIKEKLFSSNKQKIYK